ncbi:MAG: hypothetical protein NT157_04025 [Candidatus Micrarchaeota archaeon]|nr:hypothetical protein [Candidatus Micrarchaeota archaeon]
MRSVWLVALVAFAICCQAELTIGTPRTIPGVVSVATDEISFSWSTNKAAFSSFTCTGAGTAINYPGGEASVLHNYSTAINFSSEGMVACKFSAVAGNESAELEFEFEVRCVGVRLGLSQDKLDAAAYFNRPKGSGPYVIVKQIGVENLCVGAAVTPRTTVSAPAAMRLAVSGGAVQSADYTQYGIDITVPDDTPEGNYTARVGFSANGSSVTLPISIIVKWPGPVLNITMPHFGNVKSGIPTVKGASVKEVMGYRAASNAKCVVRVSGQEPVETNLGGIAPFGKSACNVSVSPPGTGARPGTYGIQVAVSSDNAGSFGLEDNYTVPIPDAAISPSVLDFGDVTFEGGLTEAKAGLIVSEIGGYTPIEGIKFVVADGESGWLTLPDCVRVEAGSRVECVFVLRLPERAKLGEKKWKLTFSAAYVKNRTVEAVANIYFFGLEAAIDDLRAAGTYPAANRFPEFGDFARASIGFLSGLKGEEMGSAELVGAISVYGGARALLMQIDAANAAAGSGDYERASDELLGARFAREKITVGMSVGGRKLQSIADAAGLPGALESLWNASLGAIGNETALNAEEVGKTDYSKASAIYKNLADLFGNADYEARGQYFGDKANEAIGTAALHVAEGKGDLDSARGETVFVNRYRTVISPFSYDAVKAAYEKAAAHYESASAAYGLAGRANEKEIAGQAAEEIRAEAGQVGTAFFVILGGAVAFVGALIFQVATGMQRYAEDEEEESLGDVLVE